MPEIAMAFQRWPYTNHIASFCRILSSNPLQENKHSFITNPIQNHADTPVPYPQFVVFLKVRLMFIVQYHNSNASNKLVMKLCWSFW